MRSVVNISMPKKLKKEVEREVKKGGYASTSEFVRHLLRMWREAQALEEIRKSQKEIRSGKGKILRSLKDLR